jgi:hypothetical protein
MPQVSEEGRKDKYINLREMSKVPKKQIKQNFFFKNHLNQVHKKIKDNYEVFYYRVK